MLNYFKKKTIIDLIIILSIFFIDRISKIYVINQSKKKLSSELFSSDYLNINLMWNEGIAFGLFSFLMIFGGALGNLYDRVFFQAVPDFIDFHVGNFHWFVFNVADIFISIGVLIMILSELKGKDIDNEKN